MSELVAVSIISAIGVNVSILIMFGIWLLKQRFRHEYLMKRAKMYQQKKLEKTEIHEPTTMDNLAKILPALKDLDLDQIQGLVDQFGGQGLGDETGLGEIGSILKNPIVQEFLKGMQQQKPAGSDEDTKGY